MIASVAAVRPGARLHQVPGPPDELVVHGGNEVFRLPRPLRGTTCCWPYACYPGCGRCLPVALPAPRLVGVLADGETPFTGEPSLPGGAGHREPLADRRRAGRGARAAEVAGLDPALRSALD